MSSFYLHFSLSPFLESGMTEMNCSLPGWMIGSFCFPGISAESSLKEGRLQLVFESTFWGSMMLFDELTLKDGPQES